MTPPLPLPEGAREEEDEDAHDAGLDDVDGADGEEAEGQGPADEFADGEPDERGEPVDAEGEPAAAKDEIEPDPVEGGEEQRKEQRGPSHEEAAMRPPPRQTSPW